MSVKTMLWDIETGPYKVWAWGMFDQNIQPDNIIEDSTILSISWKTLGERKIHGSCVGESKTERNVIEDFLLAVEDADILVHHNGDKFDKKRLTAKLIGYRLPPLHKINTIDTLKEIRAVAKFASHRMDYLTRLLCGIGKHETDMKLWRDCKAGDPKALARLLAYNKNDVKMLESLYLETRPYYRNHPNVAENDSANCPRCDSGVATLRKAYRTRAGNERCHLRCVACSAPFTISAAKAPKPLSSV